MSNIIYLPEYFKNKKQLRASETVNLKCGIFHVSYEILESMYPSN